MHCPSYPLRFSSNRKISVLFIAFIIQSFLSPHAFSQDYQREARHASEVEDSLIDGDIVELSTVEESEHNFINILYEADLTESDNDRSAVIVIHGSGLHPNWPDLVYPLRSGLAEKGYTSFSMQMPVAALNAEHKAYIPLLSLASSRLQQGITYLKEKSFDRIYVVAHSLGAAMATLALSEFDDPELTNVIKGLVIIGMADLRDSGADNIAALAKLPYPVLDIYGDNDLEAVLQTASERADAGKELPDYSQLVVNQAEHMFVGFEDEALEAITNFIESH